MATVMQLLVGLASIYPSTAPKRNQDTFSQPSLFYFTVADGVQEKMSHVFKQNTHLLVHHSF